MYTETEAFLEGVHRQMSVILTDHLAFVLTAVLNRLARYDEGIISSILTLAVCLFFLLCSCCRLNLT